jgi:nicotinate dehydrogenase subunit B
MTERYQPKQDSAPLPAPSGGMTRRKFLKRMGQLGGGIMIYGVIGVGPALARTPRQGFLGAGIPQDFNAFMRFETDGRVTCLTGKIEMGQGPITSLPQMLAEELDVAFESVDIIMGDTDLCPWDAGTFGSLTTRHFGVFLREAAAEAKGVLKELAAEKLKIPLAQVATKDGAAYDKSRPGRKISYAMLTGGKLIERRLDKLPPLKPVSEFTEIGKSRLRSDALAKVTGQAKYSADIRLEGMLYAKILRPPAHGAKLKAVDVSAARALPDVQVVQDGEQVAVLHPTPDGAARALAAVEAEFETPSTGINQDNIFEHLLKSPPAPETASKSGSLAAGEAQATQVVEQTYLDGYVAHAPIETHAALAHYDQGRLTIWASTQTPFRMQPEAARAVGLKPEQVRVITPFVGGGFGGKSNTQQGVEAARLAMITKKPVQVCWTRAEEFFYDHYRPAAIVKLRAGLNGAGQIVFWDYKTYFAGACGDPKQYYDIPNHHEQVFGRWRGGGGRYPSLCGRGPGGLRPTIPTPGPVRCTCIYAGRQGRGRSLGVPPQTSQGLPGCVRGAAGGGPKASAGNRVRPPAEGAGALPAESMPEPMWL